LSAVLSNQQIENKIVREPGGTKVGEGVRELLLSHDYEVDALTEALLFCSQRSQLIAEVIKPEVNKGIKILSDRSAYSSVAYQGVGRGLGYETIYQLNDIAVNSFWPEKVVLLDIDPKISLSRQKVADRIGSDKVDFFNKVREVYLRLADEFENNFLIINAEEDLELNLKRICTWLKVDNSK
jgi:dTMP kinase